MERAKMFEVRDAMTFIPVLAVCLEPETPAEEWLLWRCGYTPGTAGQFVLLVWLAKGQAQSDPNAWGSRTLGVAHKHILEKWPELEAGAVIDVEFILGERPEPKKSDRFDGGGPFPF